MYNFSMWLFIRNKYDPFITVSSVFTNVPQHLTSRHFKRANILDAKVVFFSI